MSQHEYPEWRNQNTQRRYPFGDESSLLSNEGLELPLGAFIDASIYPLQASAVYLHQIDPAAGVVTVRAVRDGSLVGSASMTAGSQWVLVGPQGRQVGVLIRDPDIALPASATFTPATATFVASVVWPSAPKGVQGIKVASGETLTGPITLVARGGIRMSVDGADITIDAIGTRAPRVLDPGPPITCVRVVAGNEGAMDAVVVGNLLNIGSGRDADAWCDRTDRLPDADGNLPTDKPGPELGGEAYSPCDDAEDADPPADVGAVDENWCPVDGRMFVSPTTSAVRVLPVEGTIGIIELQGLSQNPDWAIAMVNGRPPRAAQGIQIGFVGDVRR